MSGLIATVQNLWNNAKVAKAKTRAHFAVPADHVDADGPPGVPFTAGQHYFQVILHEMFLENSREWFVNYDPMALAAATYIYDKRQETVPVVAGPSSLNKLDFKDKVPEGMIFRSVPASGMHPYQGGSFAVTILLSKLARRNNVDRLLKVVEGVSSAIDPTTTLSSYLKVADTIADGVEAILGLAETVPVLGYQVTVNPSVNQRFESQYFALIDEDENEVKRQRFWVKESRLHYGTDLASSKPYRGADFILFRVAQGDKRTDERTLPFYPAWEKAKDFAAQPTDYYWGEAKAQFNTLKRNLLSSPDLTEPDKARLRTEYLSQLTTIRKEAVEEAQLAPRGAMSAEEEELQQIAAELDKLDSL